jgi:hypothetical protein
MPFLNKIFAFIFWSLLALLLNIFSPDNLLSVVGFFVVLFCALFTTLRIFNASIRRCLLITTFCISILLLQYFGQITALNVGLILALFIVFVRR